MSRLKYPMINNWPFKSMTSKIVGVVLLVAMLVMNLGISGCGTASSSRSTPTISSSNSDYFTIAVLPDTQYYSEKYPAIFDQQAQWIVDNAKAQHIVFVSQVGDLVEDYNVDTEWMNAQHSIGIIRNAGIPYSVIPGNHDLNFSAGDTTYYDKYFPYTDFTSYSWYGSGHYPPQNGAPSPNYPPNSNASNYETFSAMGQHFVILNLACTKDVLVNPGLYAWANDVLYHYSNYKAIVVTHGYIDTDGDYTDMSNVSGYEIWSNIVNVNSNVVAVICGHIYGACHTSVTGEYGNTIENLLFDSQGDPNGGDGWLRLYKFYPKLNEVSAVTYSPYLNQYDTSAQGEFDFNLNMIKTSKLSPNISNTVVQEPTTSQLPVGSIAPLAVYVQQGNSGTPVLLNTYSQSDMQALANTTQYYTGIDSMPAVVQGKATGVLLSTLINDLQQYDPSVSFGPGASLKLTCTDHSNFTYTYNYLLGATRYYYPNLYTSSADGSISGSTAGAVEIEPMFAITSYQARSFGNNLITQQVLDGRTLDTTAAYRFCFGLLSPDDSVTVGKFAKWVNKMVIIMPTSSETTTIDTTGNNN
jgi:3',5'-cyclic AMP phosphodiesterase CpdA